MKNESDNPKSDGTPNPASISRRKRHPMRAVLIVVGAICLLAAATGAYFGFKAFKQFSGPAQTIIIPKGADEAAIRKILTDQLGDYGSDVAMFWSMRSGSPAKAVGRFTVQPGDRVWSVVNRLRAGAQTPVDVKFNQVRTLSELASKVSRDMAFGPDEFIAACHNVLSPMGYPEPMFPAAFIPDTYNFYYSTDPNEVVRRLVAHRDRFWNASRREKAKALGLSPEDVTIIASIVEEETNRKDEMPLVARLYINRLDKGMKLEADPTVKFAIGDFSIKRIKGSMLDVKSAYNTYRVEGLPPGPIRIPEVSTIDAVLNAPQHDYIFMCASVDRPGYHDFTADYKKHQANGRRYREWLDSQGIN